MLFSIIVQSFVATFAMLCVIGPICMTVINTTILNGFGTGIFAGLGVAVADSIYIIAASLAISALEDILQSKAITIVGMVGSLFLFYLAYKFWNTKVNLKSAKRASKSRLKSFLTLFSITMTGPTTIITYSVVFSSFLGKTDFSALSAIVGGMCATFLFYLLVVGIISIVRKKMNEKVVAVLNKIATVIITILALKLMFEGIKSLIA